MQLNDPCIQQINVLKCKLLAFFFFFLEKLKLQKSNVLERYFIKFKKESESEKLRFSSVQRTRPYPCKISWVKRRLCSNLQTKGRYSRRNMWFSQMKSPRNKKTQWKYPISPRLWSHKRAQRTHAHLHLSRGILELCPQANWKTNTWPNTHCQ